MRCTQQLPQQGAAPSGARKARVACRSSGGSNKQPGGLQQRSGKAAARHPLALPGAAPSAASPILQHRTQLGSSSGGGGGLAAAGAALQGRPGLAFVKPEGVSNNILELNEFRRGVGLCIYRPDGLVFAARRMDDPEKSWQMPQGGIDPLENPMRAALRELHEETGITSCRIVASIDHWLEYTFPTKVKAHLDGSWLRYRGQTQKWFLLEFHGDDSEIDLSCHGHPEFSEYSWLPLDLLPASVVEFKQGVYRQVARHFEPLIRSRCQTVRGGRS